MPFSSNRLAIFLLVLVCLTAGAGAGFVRWLQNGLPPLGRLERIEPPIKTLFFAADGDTLAEFYEYNRVLVPLERVPDRLVRAILAMEDRKFYDHWGVDMRSVMRAMILNLRAGRVVQGASTITQQLARNLFIHEESGWMAQTYTRKIREALLAMEIEKRYTKDEILEMYLNHIFLGQRAYGVEAAARTYFGKHVEEIDLSESALIAGIIRNPIDYPPNKNPDLALRRRSVVLNVMVDQGIVTREEADSADAQPLALARGSGRKFESGYFVEYVRKFVESRFPPEEYMLRGLRVYTTLDPVQQRAAEAAVETHLARVEKERAYPQTREDYLALEKKGKPEYIQGALLALEPESGYIRAMVGGRSYEETNWNRATQAPRQPGSAFKLFVFTTALAEGYRASDLVLDSPVVLPEADGTSWRPHNYYRKYNGLVSLRTAFAKSINLPATKLCLAVGPDKVVETAHRLGIVSPIQPVPSIALGSPEVNLLELTTAYSVFRNGGILVEPTAVLRIEDRNGKLLYERENQAEEVIPAALASVMTSLLESVCDWQGTGYRIRQAGWKGPAAGKTGTYDNYTNAWFIGFTPETVTGVWVGFEEKINMGTNMNGAVAAQPIWVSFVTAVSDSTREGGFPLADGVVKRRICPETGFLASPSCPGAYDEVFLEGTEPLTQCNVHGQVASRPIVSFGGSR
ncbi:MAG: PBP1A family penicillin-binding protein [Candidatus Eisenbacteria bacterium]|nr:PBP1A family penicillin-binding protein [Candidatus Eisenbacteria bacterium]